jgi:lipoprotein-releasing system ATP-binding protein
MTLQNNEIALRTEGVNKFFQQPETFQVLYNISMTVWKGEFVTIMGKSGCGKSTLLYLLSTLDTEYDGSIEIGGVRVTGMAENLLSQFRNKRIGFVFQFHFLLPEFTVLENVMMPARKLATKSIEEIEFNAMERLAQMNMKEHAHKLASRLSGGQQQRVAIARALINNPDIVMADEPTGNLDSANSSIVHGIFEELSGQGNTIVAVTHDRDFASRSHRIIEMNDGRIISQAQASLHKTQL